MKKYNITLEKINQVVENTDKSILDNINIDLDIDKSLKPKKQQEHKSDTVLSIKNLHVYFKTHGHDNHVIRGISLDIKRGETFAIVGESGSGKSVFTKCLNGMNDSNSKIKQGHIYLNGVSIHDPKVTKRLFKKEDTRKNILTLFKSRSTEQVNEKTMAVKKKQDSKIINKLIEEKNKVDFDKLVLGKQTSLQKTCDEKKLFYDLYYTDMINRSLNRKSKSSLKKQKLVSKYSRKVDKLMRSHELYFGSDELKAIITENLNSFKHGKLYTTLENNIEEISTFIRNLKTNPEQVEKTLQNDFKLYLTNVQTKVGNYNQCLCNTPEESNALLSDIFKAVNEGGEQFISEDVIKVLLNCLLTTVKTLQKHYKVMENNIYTKVVEFVTKRPIEVERTLQTHAKALNNYMLLVNIYTEYLDIYYNVLNKIEDYLIRRSSNLQKYFMSKADKDKQENLNLYKEFLNSNKEVNSKRYEEIQNSIESLTKTLDKQSETILDELNKMLTERCLQNKPYLDTKLFNAEERKFMSSFTNDDLMYILQAKLKLIELYTLRKKYLSNSEQYKSELLNSFQAHDIERFEKYAKVINPSLLRYVQDINKAQQNVLKVNKDIDARIKMLDQKLPTYETRLELLETERTSKVSYLNQQIEMSTEKIIHEIETSDISNANVIINLDKFIFDVKNLCNVDVKIEESKLVNNPHSDDLVESLKRRGVINGDTVDLAKFKTNKEWSMIRGSRIATIFQDPMTSLNPLISIGEQISEVLRIHHNLSKVEAKKEAISLLTKVKIPEPEKRYKEYPFQYSGGMRQRVVIAIALACRPDILICDEPTTALDVTVQSQILDLIKELQKDYHFTIVFITHDLGVVAGVADRIGVMYGGQIVEYGTDEDIFYRPLHPYTWALLSSLPQLAVSDEPLTYIKGNPPSFNKEIQGDSFAPRSNYAMKIDFIMEPEMIKVSETHFAKTWLLDKRAPKVKKPLIIRNLESRMQETAKEFLATQKEEN